MIVFVGDGSYLMLNSDLYSSVLTGQKLVVGVCDNGGFSLIERPQTGMGGRSFNNMLEGANGEGAVRVDWAAHAAPLGCHAESVSTIGDLEEAFDRARSVLRTSVIAIRTAPSRWTPGGAFWEVGVAEISERSEVTAAHERMVEGKHRQRVGW